MKLIDTDIQGVYIIEQNHKKDYRGSFVKMFQKSFFQENDLEYNFSESYYTKSKEDVIRGMHFQLPPHDHAKLITVITGTITDVILDLRKSSPTYKKYFEVELSRENRKSIYIPRGCAHGFGVLSETAITYYLVTSEHMPEHDHGIRYDSFGYDWIIENPIISERDKNLIDFLDFKSPFK